MGPDLNAALIFVNVVRAGSFSKAAHGLGLSVSTVSDRVVALERALGVSLLTRTTRKLKLTDEGAAFFKESEAAIQTLLGAFDGATALRRQPSGTLRITAPADFASSELAAAVSEFRNKYPQVKVETYFSNRFVDLITEGFDIAIRGGHLEDSSLRSKRLGEGNLVVVASARYLQGASAIQHPRDFTAHPCIGFVIKEGDKREMPWHLRSAGGEFVRMKPDFVVSSTSFSWILSLVRSGAGLALVPQPLLKEDFARKRLVRVLPDWATEYAPVHLVYPTQRFSSPKVMEMIPILERHLRGLFA
ncbi:Transcriptional regulator, LysR family [Cystobacter fuscus DSM 2262]|uniref:Transcriptional regulator, LysR family n=1 Tax=Cystobacter fuscus (strain ATCC 25194 / DSM 2262 / NBRC 100088 / M29) TaxID=1242864 RepID=S9NWB3_CYSF2|nr:LysR family transcriptional regulator [Cystobacter fuscus]EPX56505.1 Transcriptional regulator, LysR family [Cystobacter fuscus DSM 2262]